MKAVIFGILFFVSATSAHATEWTCEAYCSVDNGAQGLVLIVGQGSNPQTAFDRVAGECGELNYPYLQDSYGYDFLFSKQGEHHEEATVVNSCKMFDPSI